MTVMDTSTHDYSTGLPRRHHSLFIEDGNFVIQVESAIFKVHRSFLAKYSSVLMEMLNAPGTSEQTEGTEENPLVMTGDTAAGWALLFELQYDSPRFSSEAPRAEHMLSVLPVAHKYCMEKIESEIIKEMRKTSRTPGYVDLMVAAQIVGSEELHQEALKGLISSQPKPNLEQARRIGVDVHHAVMAAALSSAKVAHISELQEARKALIYVDNRRCKECSQYTNWRCGYCRTMQNSPPMELAEFLPN